MKVVPISPEVSQGRKTDSADMLTRLDRLENCFLTALQELRAARLELTKNNGASTTLVEALLDAKKVAELLGQKERWVYQQVKAKKLPALKLGRYVMFSPSALQRWLEHKQTS